MCRLHNRSFMKSASPISEPPPKRVCIRVPNRALINSNPNPSFRQDVTYKCTISTTTSLVPHAQYYIWSRISEFFQRIQLKFCLEPSKIHLYVTLIGLVIMNVLWPKIISVDWKFVLGNIEIRDTVFNNLVNDSISYW